ncbi:MAG: nucleotidyl transferase AbiEii/AbiGii toxin family protein [Candidatus Binatia bacterium]
MMISSLDLADNNDLTFLAELVADLRAAAPAWKPLLVGAMARDLLLYYAYEIPVSRATEDVDLGFAVADWEDFAALRAALVASTYFEADKRVVHKIHHRQRRQVDLIPFGGLERPDGSIAWPPRGDEAMTVLGYREALASAIDVRLPEGQRVLVVSLPMLAVLKVIAWSERHATAPRRDAADLLLILKNYLDAGHQQRLYDEAPHLLDNSNFDYERAGAWLAGQDAATAIQAEGAKQTLVHQMISTILIKEVDPDGPLRLIGEVGGRDAENMRLLLAAFLSGFNGKKEP